MKKILVVLFTLIFVFTFSVVSFGLTTPTVTVNHGVVTGMIVSSPYNGVMIGAEYGIITDLAIDGEFGNNLTKLGVKYELNPSIALTGGILALGNGASTDPYIGVNAGSAINKDFMVLGELDLSSVGGQFIVMYEAGVKYNIIKQLDIRGGVLGATGNGTGNTSFELGVAYKF